MFSQKESVYAAIKAYANENNIRHEDGEVISLDKTGRKMVVEMVTQAALAGEMSLSDEALAKYNTREKMLKYCDGLVNNWLRKDTRLNGGTPYEPKNPGSRVGSGDEVVKALRALKTLATTTDEHKALIDAELNKRLEEIRAAKAPKVSVDFSKIPESIRNLFQ